MNNLNLDIQQKISSSIPQIAEDIVNLQYKKNPEVWGKYGTKGRYYSIRDAGYHLPFLTEAIVSEDESIFTEYVVWVKKLFKGLNLPEDTMKVTLECTRKVLENFLPSDMSIVVKPYIDAGISKMKIDIDDDMPLIKSDDYLGELAMDYNNSLLKGDRITASRIIIKAVESGTPVKDIYIHVFQKSQYEVGRLWLSNKITVAKEHYCSAATQQIMSQLYPYIFSTDRAGKKMVAACVGGELHEIGIRMVADFFEMDGWDTYYLGANSPVNSIIQAIEDNNADIVGLSAAMPYHRSLLRDTIDQIRNNTDNQVHILVGGNALKKKGQAINQFNADGYAPDALKAIEIANKLVN